MNEPDDGFVATPDSFEHERPIDASSCFPRPMKQLRFGHAR
jgi:hypothetical protein